jgi:hypothetical protein
MRNALWTGTDLEQDNSWRLGPAWPEVEAVRDLLEHGPGLVWLRGILPGDVDAAREAFEDFTSSLGTPLSQDRSGRRMLEVRDHGFAAGDPRFRGPHSRRALSFHTDRCDVIAFACVRPASVGGQTQVLASRQLRDRFRQAHPDLWPALQEPFVYRRHSIDPDNPARSVAVPLFTEHDGRFAASYLRVLIDRADADPELPSLRPEQRRALDALDALAQRPGLSARFSLAAGDVLLVNNWVTMHRRTSFEDAPGAPGRLLWRTWLSMPDSRAIHPQFADHFGATAAGAVRGGIHGPSRPQS